MHQRKSKKILIYVFLLLIVGSINNVSLNNITLKDIDNIKIVGLEEKDNLILLNQIRSLNLSNIFLIDGKKIEKKIVSNNLIENFFIFKRYPSSLDVNIETTKFLARINKNGKKFLVGSNGKLIEDKYSNNQLPFVFGNPEIIEFFNIKKIIDESQISFEEIESLYFFLSKRWDLELRNNIIIKLPNDNIKESLKLASEFLHNNEFKDIKIIDARIKNQIILND
jgi:cell division protein FtsQ